MIRADTKVRPYKNSLTLALTQRERGLITLLLSLPGITPRAMLMTRRGRLKDSGRVSVNHSHENSTEPNPSYASKVIRRETGSLPSGREKGCWTVCPPGIFTTIQ